MTRGLCQTSSCFIADRATLQELLKRKLWEVPTHSCFSVFQGRASLNGSEKNALTASLDFARNIFLTGKLVKIS